VIYEFQLAMSVEATFTVIVTLSPTAMDVAEAEGVNVAVPAANACTDAIDAIIAVAAANAAILFLTIFASFLSKFFTNFKL